MSLMDRIGSFFHPEPPKLEIDARGVRRTSRDGTVESVEWDRLIGVDAITTDHGPWLEDAFFVLHGDDGHGCVVPNAVARALFDHFERLPGFDFSAVIAAMGSTSNATFVCWRRSPAAPKVS
jgi:hypothetical protein